MSWYYAHQGQPRGPFEVAKLVDSLLAGREPQRVPVWREGLAEWTPAGSVPEIAAELQAAQAFFYEWQGATQGPVPPEQLAEMLRARQIPPETLVWRRGFPEWRLASSVGELGAASAVPPPVVPGVAASALFAAAAAPTGEPERVWAEGPVLVTERFAELPDRCLKCNAPAAGFRKKLTLRWHKPGWYLLVLLNIIVYAIVASFVSNKAELRIALCPQHRSRHRTMVGAAWGAVLVPLVVFFFGLAQESGGATVIGLLLFLAGIVFAIVATRIATPQRIDEHFAWVKGAGAPFLASLPRWRGYEVRVG